MVLPMVETLENILTPPPIMGVTINSVSLHPAVRAFLYAVMVLSFLAGLALFLRRKKGVGAAARKAALLSFFLSGTLAAATADIGWATWVVQDFNEMSGLSTDGKMMRIEGPLYDFCQRARAVIQDSYQLYAPDSYAFWRAQYDLLPLRKREQARYIVVIEDPAARYDAARRTFSRDGTVLRDMDLVLNYTPRVYVLRGH